MCKTVQIALVALSLIATSLGLWGQSGTISGQVVQPSFAASNATIRVCPSTATGTPCSPLATIYLDSGLTVPASNPYTSDQYGNYSVFAAAGYYLVQVTTNGITYAYSISTGNVNPIPNLTNVAGPPSGVNYNLGSGQSWQLDASQLTWNSGVGGSSNIVIQNAYNPGSFNNAGGIIIKGAPTGSEACAGSAELLGNSTSNGADNNGASVTAQGGCANGFGATGSGINLIAGSTTASNAGGGINLEVGTGPVGGGGNGSVQVKPASGSNPAYFYLNKVTFSVMNNGNLSAGAMLYCTNCQGAADGAFAGSIATGSGTGTIVIRDNSNWRVFGTTPSTSGYAPLASPAFTGTPTAPTPTAGDASTKVSTTQFVANAITVAGFAPLSSPAFTGTPTAPTPTSGDNSTKIATTAFVSNAVSGLAPLASPAFTGTPTAPTPTSGDNSTKIATTAFVSNAVSSLAPINSPALTGTPTAPTPTLGDASTKVSTTQFVANAITAAPGVSGEQLLGLNYTPVTVNASTTSLQTMQSLTLPANKLNSLGKTIRIVSYGTWNPSSSGQTVGIGIGLLGTVSFTSGGSVTGQTWRLAVTCTTTTTGSSGVLTCEEELTLGYPFGLGTPPAVGSSPMVTSTFATDLTSSLAINSEIVFSTASTSNSGTGTVLMMESLN